MQASTLTNFLQSTIEQGKDYWDWLSVDQAASQNVDDSILGPLSSLLRGDIRILWAKWFAWSLCDPNYYVVEHQDYAHVFAGVVSSLNSLPLEAAPDERRTLASLLANAVYEEVLRLRAKGRGQISRSMRELLWDLGSPTPRCWICGHTFPNWARQRFLGIQDDTSSTMPMFVDFLTGKGVSEQDLRIEVDHVLPASMGGTEIADNLRLSCGWCNRAKSNRTVLYDAATSISFVSHPQLGRRSRPHPFWVVRALAVRGRCDHRDCGVRASEAALFVYPRIRNGQPTPANLSIACEEHDPISSERRIPRSYLLK